jgi:hypothetical protein
MPQSSARSLVWTTLSDMGALLLKCPGELQPQIGSDRSAIKTDCASARQCARDLGC